MNNQCDQQIYLWQIMYQMDENGEALLDWLDDWGEEGLDNFGSEEKEFNEFGFEIENNYF